MGGMRGRGEHACMRCTVSTTKVLDHNKLSGDTDSSSTLSSCTLQPTQAHALTNEPVRKDRAYRSAVAPSPQYYSSRLEKGKMRRGKEMRFNSVS